MTSDSLGENIYESISDKELGSRNYKKKHATIIR